jgi:hypothetical protein
VVVDWVAPLEAMGAPPTPGAPDVRLYEYPVALGVRQEERTVELVRELQLITLDSGHHPHGGGVPAPLLEFAGSLFTQYGPALASPREELEAAHAAGKSAITVTYPLRPGSLRAVLQYARLMEHADEFCRAGSMISLAPDDEVHALRRWTVEEFVRQYHGLAPRPWTAAARDAPA